MATNDYTSIDMSALPRRILKDLRATLKLTTKEREIVTRATERWSILALSQMTKARSRDAEIKAIKATLLSLGEVRAVAVEKAIRDSLRTAISAGLALL